MGGEQIATWKERREEGGSLAVGRGRKKKKGEFFWRFSSVMHGWRPSSFFFFLAPPAHHTALWSGGPRRPCSSATTRKEEEEKNTAFSPVTNDPSLFPALWPFTAHPEEGRKEEKREGRLLLLPFGQISLACRSRSH